MANITVGRKSGFIRRSGVMRRETVWIAATVSNRTIAAASTAVVDRALNAAALALRPFTVVRSRYQTSIQSDQSAATEDQLGAMGQCVVSDQAVTVGVTAVPNPLTDIGSDLWMLWEGFNSSFLFKTAVGSDAQFATSRAVDSKAMRKVEEGQDLVVVMESGGTSGGFTLSTFGRVLLKLH